MIDGLIEAWFIVGDEIQRTSEEVPQNDMSAESWRMYIEMRCRMTKMRSMILQEIAKEEAKQTDAADV